MERTIDCKAQWRVDAQCNGCDGCPFEYCGPECDLLCKNAATLIESMQSQIADYHHMSELVDGKMEENQRLRRINENLQEQLAASQHRERAAVEDIEKMMRICEKGSCHFCADGDCTNSPMCTPKWRGPQEAGEGTEE